MCVCVCLITAILRRVWCGISLWFWFICILLIHAQFYAVYVCKKPAFQATSSVDVCYLTCVLPSVCLFSWCVLPLLSYTFFSPFAQEQMKPVPTFLSITITLFNRLEDILTLKTQHSQIEGTIIISSGFPKSVKLWIFGSSFSLISVGSALCTSLLTCCFFCAPKAMSPVQAHAVSRPEQSGPLLTGLVCPGCPVLLLSSPLSHFICTFLQLFS